MILQDPHLDFDLNSKDVTDTDDCSLSNEMQATTVCIPRRRGQSSYGSWGQEEGNVFTILSRARFVTNTFFLQVYTQTQGITHTQTIAKVWVKHTLTHKQLIIILFLYLIRK